MYNWSTDTANLAKNKDDYEAWKIEQLVNFGLNGEKISKKKLLKYWEKLKIDPQRRKLLSF